MHADVDVLDVLTAEYRRAVNDRIRLADRRSASLLLTVTSFGVARIAPAPYSPLRSANVDRNRTADE